MTFQVIDPTTGQLLHTFPILDATGRDAAISASAEAYTQWRKTSMATRADLLRRVAALMRAEVESLAKPMVEEMGKPIREARAEVEKSAWCAEHYASHAESYLATEMIKSDALISYVQYLPIGPVLGILPWNAPFWLAFRFAAPALMAGNTCLMKHDGHVPACAAAIADIFTRAGAPEGVFQNLPLDTPDIASAINDERIRAVSFTGSDRAGSIVAATGRRANQTRRTRTRRLGPRHRAGRCRPRQGRRYASCSRASSMRGNRASPPSGSSSSNRFTNRFWPNSKPGSND